MAFPRSSADGSAHTMPFLVLIPIIVLTSATSLSGQLVEGRVLDTATDQPIAAASVTLLGNEGEALRNTLTDSAGAFVLEASQSGRYALRASRIGYEEVTSPPFDLLPNETLAVELRIGVEAIALAPLTVTSDRQPLVIDGRLERQGFYERRDRYEDMGYGYFFNYNEIQRHNPFNLSDVVRIVPGIRTVSLGGRHYRMGGRTGCRPVYFLDGHKVLIGRTRSIDDVVSPNSLVAIEVYPSQWFNSIGYPGCSVLLWTGPPPNSN